MEASIFSKQFKAPHSQVMRWELCITTIKENGKWRALLIQNDFIEFLSIDFILIAKKFHDHLLVVMIWKHILCCIHKCFHFLAVCYDGAGGPWYRNLKGHKVSIVIKFFVWDSLSPKFMWNLFYCQIFRTRYI